MNEVGIFSGFFDTTRFHVGSFLVVSISNLDQFLTPLPLPIADVVYGWSLRFLIVVDKSTNKIRVRQMEKTIQKISTIIIG